MTFKCPACNQSLEADEDVAGKEVQCPNCGRYIAVPAAEPQAVPPSAPVPTASPRPVIGLTVQSRDSKKDEVRVALTDIDIPFWSMLRFMVKWALAAIPACIVLMGIYMLFAVLFLGGCAALLTGAAMHAPH